MKSLVVTSQIRVNIDNSETEQENSDQETIDYYHEFISLEDSLSKSSSDLPQVTESSAGQQQLSVENLYNIVTENIQNQNLTLYKERSPRYETQQGAYEKIEAKYGAWENSSQKLVSHGMFFFLLILVKTLIN